LYHLPAIIAYDDWGRVVSNIVDTVEAPSRPENTFKSTRRKDICLDWFDTLSAARAHVEGARRA